MSTPERKLPTGEAFGFPAPQPQSEGDSDPLLEDLTEEGDEIVDVVGEVEERETPEGEEDGATVIEYEPRHAAPEPTPEETAAEEFERILFAGREFESVEDAERSYQEMQSWATRSMNDARAQSEAFGSLQAQVAQQQQTLQSLLPYLSQQLLAENPELAEQLQRQQEIDQLVSQKVQQQVGPIVQQSQAQLEENQRRAQFDTNVETFYRSHPEVEEGSDLDRKVGAAFVELRRTTGLNMAHPEALDVALECVQNPKLITIYRLNPTYLDTPEGRQYARQMAGAPEIQAAIEKGQQKRQSNGEASRRAAFVEHGGSGIPAGTPGKQPKGDEFDEALDLWKSERESSIFFQ